MLTVAEALQIDEFSGAQVVAGRGGLLRSVAWVHVAAVEDAARWLGERLTRVQAVGVVVGLAGVALVVAHKFDLGAITLGSLAAVTWALACVTGGRFVFTPGGGSATCWQRNCSRTKRPRAVGDVSSGFAVSVRNSACPRIPARSELAGKAAIVDVPVGKGHVVMFANNPMWRHQTHGSFSLLFNAILNYDNLGVGRPAPRAGGPAATEEDEQ